MENYYSGAQEKNPFQVANCRIFDLLYENCIFEIDFDTEPIDGWLYTSRFPLSIPKQDALGSYHFYINLYKWCDSEQCLKLIKLSYVGVPEVDIIYVNNSIIDDTENQFGKIFIKEKKFTSRVKPLILKGFREIAFQNLIN